LTSTGTGKQRGQAGYGDGRAAIRAGDDLLIDEEALVAELLARLESPDYRPPTLPVVAVELMALSSRADVAIPQIVALLERDAMIAGRVLEVAGAAGFAGTAKITSLREAVMRLGLLRIRDLVMAIALNMRVFKCEPYDDAMERVRRHSVATAHLCRAVSKYTPIEGEFAFMAGLLHDVGVAGTLLSLAERATRQKPPPDLLAVWPAVERVHERAGEIMAKHWQLPADIRLALSAHHQILLGGHVHPLAATVALANELALDGGTGLVEKPPETVDAEVAATGPTGADPAGAPAAIDAADWLAAHSELDRTRAATLARSREALGLDERRAGLVAEEAKAVLEQLATGA